MICGFSNMISPQSISQCSGRGVTNHGTKKLARLVLAEIDINFIFRHPRCGDGGRVPYRKNVDAAFYIEMLQKLRICIRKKLELWVENLFVLHHNTPPSHRANSVQKFLENNNMWLMPHPWYSLDLVPCDFFYFPKVEIGAEGEAPGGFGRNKIENGRLPAKCSQIYLLKVL